MGSIYSKWWNSLHALIAEQNDAIRHDLALSPFLFLFRLLGIYFWLDGRPILDDPLPIFFFIYFFFAQTNEKITNLIGSFSQVLKLQRNIYIRFISYLNGSNCPWVVVRSAFFFMANAPCPCIVFFCFRKST